MIFANNLTYSPYIISSLQQLTVNHKIEICRSCKALPQLALYLKYCSWTGLDSISISSLFLLSNLSAILHTNPLYYYKKKCYQSRLYFFVIQFYAKTKDIWTWKRLNIHLDVWIYLNLKDLNLIRSSSLSPGGWAGWVRFSRFSR